MLKEGLVVFHATPLFATSVGEKKRQDTNSEGGDDDDDDDAGFTRAKLLPSVTCNSTYTVFPDSTSDCKGTLGLSSAPDSARWSESSASS